MGNKLYREAHKTAKNAVAQDGRWVSGVSGIVAENIDPENQHRIKVVIPAIDENLIYDEWIRPFVFCLGNGYGTVFIPPLGTEVALFGEMGQKHNLFYIPLYNEVMLMPSEFRDVTDAGFKVQGNIKIISDNSTLILARKIEAMAEELAELKGANVNVSAEQTAQLLGNQIKIEADGSITISGNSAVNIKGGNITISGNSVKILNRLVLNNGQPI